MSRTLGLLCLAIAALLPPSVGLSQQVVQWQPSLDSAQRLAGQTNRLVLIYFSGRSCGYCRRLEAEVLNQPAVAAAINAGYVPVKVVADDLPSTARQYGITKLPTTVIATPQGQIVNSRQGFMPADEYVGRINQVAADFKSRREMYAQNQPGSHALAVNQPMGNQPVANLPPMGQTPPAGQPVPGALLATTAPPTMNQPVANQQPPTQPIQPPFGGPATTAPPMMNQPVGNQPPMVQTLPQGQPPMGGGPNAGPADYGQSQRPIAGPPVLATQPPQTPPQLPPQGPQGFVGQPGVNQPPMTPQPPLIPPQGPPVVATPPGNIVFGLDGFCPVTLCEKEKWVRGDPRFGITHRGRTYLFAGPAEQQRFNADPDKYAPVAQGNDVVLAADQGMVVPGLRKHGVFVGKRVYLFSSEASLQKFLQNRNAYAGDTLEANRSGSQPRPQWR
jgi:thioredoxin-related protein/YHS domain-containing protein